MKSNPTSILLFDIMNTLVYDPIAREVPEFFGLQLDELYALKHPTAWVEFERGEISDETFYEIYLPHLPDPIDGKALRSVLDNAYRWLDGMESLLATLSHQKVAMHAFSNYPIWYAIIEDKLALSRFLSWSFVSCDTGIRKPNERAYIKAAAELNVSPRQCLFIDDRPQNCTAARNIGMDAIVFDNSDQLVSELSKRQII